MRRHVTITDLTRMSGDQVCVAGIDDEGTCVRPVTQGGVTESHLYQEDRLVIRPRAVVEFDLTSARLTPPHIEDRKFTPSAVKPVGVANLRDWERVLNEGSFRSLADIFDGHLQGGRYVLPGAETRSLGTIRDVQLNDLELRREEQSRYLISFADGTGEEFTEVAVVDLTFRSYLDAMIAKGGDVYEAERTATDALFSSERVYLRIGLARPWSSPGQPRACWRQVTGIHTFPDYLRGKTLADFA